METGKRVPVKAALKSHCWIDANDYQSLYQQSLQDSVGFWRSQAQRIYASRRKFAIPASTRMMSIFAGFMTAS